MATSRRSRLRAVKLHAIDYSLPVPSAQVKSAILLAGLFADGVTTVRESVRTRDHTELALREFGATIEVTKGAVRIHPRPCLAGATIDRAGRSLRGGIPDGRALVLPDSSLTLHNVGLNPTRARVLDFLISIGAPIHVASRADARG